MPAIRHVLFAVSLSVLTLFLASDTFTNNIKSIQPVKPVQPK